MSEVLHRTDNGLLTFWCEGCNEAHGIWPRPLVNPKTGAMWTWNGDMVKPTFSPSVHVLPTKTQPRCHSYVTGGSIQFLGDCGHSMAGKTVPLKPW